MVLPVSPVAPPQALPGPPVVVAPRDALVLADLALQAGYSSSAVLVPAAAARPGGSVVAGAGALEESVHRRTDLARYTMRMSEYYPIPPGACLVARDVTVFRGPEKWGYPFLSRPFRVHVVLASASKAPSLSPSPFPQCPGEMVYAHQVYAPRHGGRHRGHPIRDVEHRG